jgi:hypothetical protein
VYGCILLRKTRNILASTEDKSQRTRDEGEQWTGKRRTKYRNSEIMQQKRGHWDSSYGLGDGERGMGDKEHT